VSRSRTDPFFWERARLLAKMCDQIDLDLPNRCAICSCQTDPGLLRKPVMEIESIWSSQIDALIWESVGLLVKRKEWLRASATGVHFRNFQNECSTTDFVTKSLLECCYAMTGKLCGHHRCCWSRITKPAVFWPVVSSVDRIGSRPLTLTTALSCTQTCTGRGRGEVLQSRGAAASVHIYWFMDCIVA
jgi:hypothetical protein